MSIFRSIIMLTLHRFEALPQDTMLSKDAGDEIVSGDRNRIISSIQKFHFYTESKV